MRKKIQTSGKVRQSPTFDFTTLPTLSFRVTSTAVSLAAIVLFSWPVTGSKVLEIAREGKRQISRNPSIIRHVIEAAGKERQEHLILEYEGRRGEAGTHLSRDCLILVSQSNTPQLPLLYLTLLMPQDDLKH